MLQLRATNQTGFIRRIAVAPNLWWRSTTSWTRHWPSCCHWYVPIYHVHWSSWQFLALPLVDMLCCQWSHHVHSSSCSTVGRYGVVSAPTSISKRPVSLLLFRSFIICMPTKELLQLIFNQFQCLWPSVLMLKLCFKCSINFQRPWPSILKVKLGFVDVFNNYPLFSIIILGFSFFVVVVKSDRSLMNLHLLHTSYFLFVMTITLLLYAIIRGRPAKMKTTHAAVSYCIIFLKILLFR